MTTPQGSGHYQTQPRQPQPPKKDDTASLIVGSIVVLFIIGLIVWVIVAAFSEDSDAESEAVDKWDAQAMCKQFVEDALKAPSSAEFSGETAYGSGTSWTSTGTVDAQNSFGAMIRSDYRCEMRYEPATDMWHLESLSGLD